MDDLKDVFKRYYTAGLLPQENKTVYDLFKYKKVNVLLKDYKSGEVLTDLKDLEFPEGYSQNACDIIASKYFRKLGIRNEAGYENSLKMVVHRIVNFWSNSLVDEGIIQSDEEKSIFYDEMAYAFLSQMYAPNSPQWFNTGLAAEYGIKGSKSGYYYYDEKSQKILQSEDSYTRTQASACFILSIQDRLLGPHSIAEQYASEIKLFKGGSGTGTNFSNLRAKGEKLSGGGISSGVMSFLKGFDRNAGAIKSGGTTRRAAKMVCIDVNHPEIMDFINWKAKEEEKVRALGKMGYDTDINGEAYETVSGQNSNNSVRFSDQFMERVSELNENPDSEILLEGRIDSSVNKTIKIKTLWDSFNKASHDCADPAAQFIDRFNAWHTCPAGEDGKANKKYNLINSTNPCGEYAFLDDTSCNLASINIYKFYDPESKEFDIEGYVHLIGLIQLALEASINMGQYPTEDIARRTYMFRTTGLGLSNIAALFMVLGYPYDSDESRNIAAALCGIMTGHSYYISALMAKRVGPFKKYELNKQYMMRVIKNHSISAGCDSSAFEGMNYEPMKVDHNLLKDIGLDYIGDCLKDCFNNALDCGKKYGYRNAQVTALAPTGTISFAMDCGSTSIEPFFSHIIYKKLYGGGMMKVVNPVIEISLKHLSYAEDEIKAILEYMINNDADMEKAPHIKPEHLPIFDTATCKDNSERFIQPLGHVKMVAAITPLISGAVSKTVNLPGSATVDDFKDVYLTAWKLGVKGITLYRDHSKASQPLNSTLDSDSKENLESLTYKELLEKVKNPVITEHYAKRDKINGIRTGTTHPAKIEDVKVYTTVNRNENGDISEIYITTDREGTIITGLLNSLSKAISVMLQYHVPPKDISKMLRGQKYEPYGFVQRHPYIKYVTSISDLISKIIDIELGDFSRCEVKPETQSITQKKYTAYKYIEKGTENLKLSGERVYGATCPNCSSTRMIKSGTCMVCQDCGSTTGCS